MDVGTTLRHARERKGLTIEQLARTTRITASLLHALENNAFDKVPSGIFARGFIRSYAREVGLDPEEMVQQYLEESGDTIGTAEPVAGAELDEDIRVMQVDPEPVSGRATWGYALIVAALLVAFVSSTRTGNSDDALASVVAAQAAEPASPNDSTGAEPDAVATTGEGLVRFDIVPSGPCWVEVIVDGKRVVYRTMQPGERETIAAREIALRVGDPAAFSYTINGRPGRPLGPAGTPVSVTLTSDSYREFLAS